MNKITDEERAAILRLAELGSICRTLDLAPVVELPRTQDEIDEANYEMACQAEAIRLGEDY